MTNDLLSRFEAALGGDEPFASGDHWERVACFAAGQELRRLVLGRPDAPVVQTERFRADTINAIGPTHVYPAIWSYARRHSIAFQLADVVPMTAAKLVTASLTPAGLPPVRFVNLPTAEGDSVAKSDAIWEATPVTVQTYTAVVWSIVSGELIDDIAAPVTGDGVAQIGKIFLDALLDEVDRVFLEGDTTAGDKINGVIKLAGASAAAGTSPAAALAAIAPAAIPTVVWVLDPATADALIKTPATINALDSLSQLASFPTIAGSILGRPAVVVAPDWLGGAKGVVAAFKRAVVLCLRTAPDFQSTTEEPEAWTAGAYAIRALVRFGMGVVQPTMIVKLT